jgi:type IV secretory pathway ATPase VirB11/archaellum biosynthesis ATPase
VYRLNAIIKKIPKSFFILIEKKTPEIIMETQENLNSQRTSEPKEQCCGGVELKIMYIHVNKCKSDKNYN